MHVDFFIAGVQKGGTTALDAILRRHPDIEMAETKEPHFFDNEAIDWNAPDYNLLHRHYSASRKERLRGEATPIYSYWPNAPERILAYNSAAKIIVALRHPALRAFSHWRMEVTRHAETLPFAEAIRHGRQRVAQSPGGVHRVYSYVERGFYAAQVRHLLSLFPRNQIAFHRTDALWSARQDTLSRILCFLGLCDFEDLNDAPNYVVPLRSRDDLPLEGADQHYLTELFSPDIEETAELTGLDLIDWLSQDYREPMARA